MRIFGLSFVVAAVGLLVACGIDPAKIPSHELYAPNGGEVDAGDHVAIAVFGATHASVAGLPGEQPSAPFIADLSEQMALRDVQVITLTGNYVRRSATSEWRAFDEQWKDVLRGSTLSDVPGRRKVAPLPGGLERVGDSRMKGFGAAFENVGAPIGYNRVGSWYYFDVKTKGKVWRLVFLDTRKRQLGSRWQEQLFWLPKVVSERAYDSLLVFMPDPLVTMAQDGTMDRDDGPSDLLNVIDENSDIGKLVAVVSGGAATNEAYLPSGNFGELYIVAGNSGVPADSLARWGAADTAGLKDVSLEPMFDMALMKQFDAWSEPGKFTEKVIDQAKARGTFETYTGIYDGGAFPVQGWWVIDLEGKNVRFTFRMRDPGGKLRDVYAIRYEKMNGWISQAK
jgi:hypothetical protein